MGTLLKVLNRKTTRTQSDGGEHWHLLPHAGHVVCAILSHAFAASLLQLVIFHIILFVMFVILHALVCWLRGGDFANYTIHLAIAFMITFLSIGIAVFYRGQDGRVRTHRA